MRLIDCGDLLRYYAYCLYCLFVSWISGYITGGYMSSDIIF